MKTKLMAPVVLFGAGVLVAGFGAGRPAAAQGLYVGGALSHAAINAVSAGVRVTL